MSVKGKILIIVVVFGLLISIIAGSIIGSYRGARHEVNVVGSTLDVVSALMQTRLAIISRISLSMDYILTGQARQKRDLEELEKITGDSFRDWFEAIERYMSLVPGEEEELERFRRIEKEYGILHEEIERAVSLAEEGRREEAYRLLEGTELDHSVERALAVEFFHSEIKERKEFEESYHELVMRLGVISWWGDGGREELKRAKFLFYDFLTANKAYTAILMQYRELIDYLVAAEEEEKREFLRYGALAGASLDEWEAIQVTYSDHPSGGEGGSRANIGDIRRRYNEFQSIAGRMIGLREQGEREKAFALKGELPAFHENLLAVFLKEGKMSKKAIEAAQQNMLRNIYSADRGAVILLLVAGLGVLSFMISTVLGIFRPLDALQRGTELLGQGRLDHRISLNREDELGRLSASFDSMAASLEADITRRKEMERQLHNSEQQLRLLSSHILDVQEKERMRISRELHDDLGQSLALLKLRTGSLARNLGENDGGLRNELLGLSDSLDGIIEKTRRISQELEPSMLEDLGLTTAVRRLLEEFSRHYDARCRIDIEDMDDHIGNRAKLVLYRIFQEALTNIAKHSHASEISCTVRRENQAVKISIEDNGDGFDPASVSPREGSGWGMGLMTMSERARMICAVLTIDSGVGRGTRLSLTVPADKRKDG
jgi:signal transduction histidine kinase/CHASE3 domain sensor protein